MATGSRELPSIRGQPTETHLSWQRMSGIISGRDWLETRLRHLEAALEGDLDSEERAAILTEIDQLRREEKVGRRRRLRWLIIGGRLPEP